MLRKFLIPFTIKSTTTLIQLVDTNSKPRIADTKRTYNYE